MNNEEFEEKLTTASLTKEHFAELTNTPIATIKNWFAKRHGVYGNCPQWVKAYLDLYIENNENKIHIKKLIEEVKRGTDNK
ncbi:MAG: XRE family transcriptional regulator [Sulfurovum sp.]|nr:XRE family transcriptional regulator [Sulfurovum sp.]